MIASAVSYLALGSVPEFAQDYYAGEFLDLDLNQGGIDTPDGACCSPNSPQCKIQLIAEGSDNYVELSKNRTRNDSPQGIIANLYLQKKQMALQPDGTGGYVCAQYCPLTDTMEPLAIKPNALHLGKHEIHQGGGGVTKSVDEYYWTDRIIIIPLDHQSFYVDTSVNPPAPFYVSDAISPFGQKLAVENTSYLQFTAGPADPKIFNISGIAACPESQNCNSNNGLGSWKVWNKFTDTVYQKAEKLVAVMPAAKAKKLATPKRVAADQPTFVGDYTATEKSLLLENQGGHENANGDYCCLKTQLGQCQIQLQSLNGQHYVDYSNNRTRFEDVANGITVNDYKKHKTYDIEHNATIGKDVCVKYCPLDPEETLDNLFLDPDAKDLGATTLNGQQVEKWEWKEVILKIIKMSTTDFFADQSNASMAIPVFMNQKLTPFDGPQIGSENHTWANVKAGPIDPTKFTDIVGLDTCPEDPQCQQPSWQHKRLAFRQYATWAKYAVASF